jgi:hypothetical protein
LLRFDSLKPNLKTASGKTKGGFLLSVENIYFRHKKPDYISAIGF